MLRFLLVLLALLCAVAVLIGVLVADPNRYRGDVEDLLSEAIGQPVSLGEIRAGWTGWTPELRLSDVSLLHGDPLLQDNALASNWNEVRLMLAPWRSLTRGALTASRIVIDRPVVTLRGPLARPSTETNASSGADLLLTLSSAINWAKRLGTVALRDASLVWQPKPSGASQVLIDKLSIDIRSDHERNTVTAHIATTSNPTLRQFNATLTTHGLPGTPAWSGELTLNADTVNVAHKAFSEALPESLVRLGALDVSVRGSWGGGNPGVLAGTLSLGQSPTTSSPQSLFDANATYTATRTQSGLRLELSPMTLDGISATTTTARVNAVIDENAGSINTRILADEIQLPELARWLSIFAPQYASLSDFNPHGVIRDLRIEHDNATDDRGAAWHATARFANVATQGPTSLQDLEGEVFATNAGGRIKVTAGSIDAMPSLAISKLDGAIDFSSNEDNWQLTTETLNATVGGVDMHARGTVRIPNHASGVPHADFSLYSPSFALTALPALLAPVKKLGAVQAWLDLALQGGYIDSARLRFVGDVTPPYLPKLDVRASMLDATLDYDSEWPLLEAMNGKVVLQDSMLDITVADGRSLGAGITDAHISITDFDASHPMLTITGEAAATTTQAIEFVMRSPLKSRLQRFFERVQIDGKSMVTMHLQKRLTKYRTEPKRPLNVQGTLAISDARANVQGLASPLEHLSGDLAFTEHTVAAQHISATYLGRALNIGVSRGGATKPVTVEIDGGGDAEFLLDYLTDSGLSAKNIEVADSLLSHLEGGTNWRATLSVSSDPQQNGEIPLRVVSDLKGITMQLPPPLGKESSEIRSLEVRTVLRAQQTTKILTARLNNDVQARLHLRKNASGRMQFEALGVALGADTTPGDSNSQGIHVNGNLERLVLTDWLPILAQHSLGAHSPQDPVSDPQPRSIRLNVQALEGFGVGFVNTSFHAHKSAQGHWIIDFSGADIDGTVSLPLAHEDRPIEARFKRLNVHTLDNTTEPGSTTQRRQRSVTFNCARCVINGRDWGAVETRTLRQPGGIRIESLRIDAPLFRVNAQGFWSVDDGRGATSLSGTFEAPEIASLLASFGFENLGLVGGATSVTGKLAWPGAPFEFDVGGVKGNVSLKMGAGRLPNVKRGTTGRVFGLLMIADLPKRLTLNFEDLSSEGLTFSGIDGSFRIESGDAYTGDLLMQSQTADILISGRTGLLREEYDQLITVTPKLSSSLPFAPVWLAEKILRRRFFDTAFSYRYTVNGSWDEPVIEPAPEVRRDNAVDFDNR